jgi:hypothetical protein
MESGGLEKERGGIEMESGIRSRRFLVAGENGTRAATAVRLPCSIRHHDGSQGRLEKSLHKIS